MTYQFSANGMVGASGTFTNLHYPNEASGSGLVRFEFEGRIGFLQSPPLEDALHRGHVSIPDVPGLSDGWAERDSDKQRFTFSIRSISSRRFRFRSSAARSTPTRNSSGCRRSTGWSPAGGASMSWQGKLTSFAASYSRIINSGGGLSGAVEASTASGSFRRQLTRRLSMSIGGELRKQRCSGCVACVQQWRTNNLRKCVGAAPDRRTFQRAGAIYAFASELQRHRGDIQRPQPKSCGGYDLVSVFETVGKVV